MGNLSIIGKYLDQPRLVGKFSKTVPTLLIGGGGVFLLDRVQRAPEENKHKEFIKNVSVLTATIGSTLLATRGIGQIKFGKKVLLKGFEGLSEKIDLNELIRTNTKLIDDFVKNNNVSQNTAQILGKAKTKILKFGEIKAISNELSNYKNGKNFLNRLIPNPENVDSSHIFKEIKRLSIMGLIPVLGGITGGIFGDKLTEKNWQERIPNKIKEGSYQYLANIFLCNIGAGGALALLEKAKITSKSARAVGMIAGIIAVGIVGGSAIANLIGKIFINPIVTRKHKQFNIVGDTNEYYECKNKHNCSKRNGLYSERKPEPLDIGLHADDIATVAVLSGLKWIEPALPILYSISGYRAGIGYRN